MTLERRTPLIRKTPLARSEFKRSTNPMQRGGALPRRREKPRKHVNETLRARYKAENGTCELIESFPGRGRKSVLTFAGETGRSEQVFFINTRGQLARECHHVFSGIQGLPRYDELWNLIHLSPIVHLWCEKYADDSLSLCITLKRLKGEFDRRRVEEVLTGGSRHVDLGYWLSSRKPRWAFVLPVWEGLCRELA